MPKNKMMESEVPPNLGNRWEYIENQYFSGGNAKVYHAKDSTKAITTEVAIKVLEREDRYDRFKREATKAYNLHHNNIIPVLDFNLPDIPGKNNIPYIIMPWCKNGSFKNYINNLNEIRPEEKIKKWATQLLTAVKYLHEEKGYAHRDIKPANLLIDDNQNLLLSDFGLLFDEIEDERLTGNGEIVGSRGYRAPELLNGRYEGSFLPADIYSIGRTIWALVTGEEPRENMDLLLEENNLVNRFGPKWIKYQDIVRVTSEGYSSRPTINQLLEIFDDHTIESLQDDVNIEAMAKKQKIYFENNSQLYERKESNAKYLTVKKYCHELHSKITKNIIECKNYTRLAKAYNNGLISCKLYNNKDSYKTSNNEDFINRIYVSFPQGKLFKVEFKLSISEKNKIYYTCHICEASEKEIPKERAISYFLYETKSHEECIIKSIPSHIEKLVKLLKFYTDELYS